MVCNVFLEPVEVTFPRQGVIILLVAIFCGFIDLNFMVCPVGVFS